MTLIGYTMMCEQAGPKQLVRDVALAVEAGCEEQTPVLAPYRSAELPAGGSRSRLHPTPVCIVRERPAGKAGREDAGNLRGFREAKFLLVGG
jgi:hypothetical protein